ncbi:MAG: sugar phosphate isomerase/epimerase [Lentisphaeria bacterium]|nr:sugar phosphate isomerase/epimerase [Lentisphaeria bacterium]
MGNGIVFSHFYPFEHVDERLLPSIFAEFRDNGVENLVFTDSFSTRLLKSPEFFQRLKAACHDVGVRLREMHAPFGECYDLACESSARRPGLFRDHLTCMRYAAETGSRTYTIHVGAWDSVYLHKPNELIRPLVLEALEQLIPEAEKLDLILALENAFERSNAPTEVMYYVNTVGNAHVGCCFDSGHANVMAARPGKTQEQYGPHMLHTVWQEHIEFCTDAFELMAPAMVTCHLHDNDGFSDQHRMPGDGTVDWADLSEKLRKYAPRLRSIQSEVNTVSRGYSIRALCGKFREIFPGLA